jgi:hypothetical protein
MNKRFQVFVSSTYTDLIEERNEVIKALLELDCIPCGMEYFPAANEEQWSYISSLIDDCDYYVLIIGGRYGSLSPDGISYTEKEYRYALQKEIPAIAFVHSQPAKLSLERSEQESENRKKLADFRDFVQQRLCKHWENTYELGAVVSRSLTQLIKRHPRPGWIRADQAMSEEMAEELLRQNKQIRELQSKLEGSYATGLPDASALAQGSDTVSLTYSFTVQDRKKNWQDPAKEKKVTDTVFTTWNEIFRFMSPYLETGTPETTARSILSRFAEERLPISISTRDDGYSFQSVRLSTESFTMLKIQFTALRLIETYREDTNKQTRRAAWRLSKQGMELMYSLIAVRKANKEDVPA